MPKLKQVWGSYSHDQVLMVGGFQLNGAGAPTVIRDGTNVASASKMYSVVRTSKGLYTVTVKADRFPIPVRPFIVPYLEQAATPTTPCDIEYVKGSWSQSARTFQLRVLTQVDLPTIQTGIAVSSNAVTLANAGYVTQVHATTATSAGVKTILLTGAPAAGQVTVSYSASGVPTLTFNATDAVTVTSVVQVTTTVNDSDAGDRVGFVMFGAWENPGVDPA